MTRMGQPGTVLGEAFPAEGSACPEVLREKQAQCVHLTERPAQLTVNTLRKETLREAHGGSHESGCGFEFHTKGNGSHGQA